MFTNNVNIPLKKPFFFCLHNKKTQTLYLPFESIFHFQTFDKAVKMPILTILNIKNGKIKFENCEFNSCLGSINCVHSGTCINLIIKCIVD